MIEAINESNTTLKFDKLEDLTNCNDKLSNVKIVLEKVESSDNISDLNPEALNKISSVIQDGGKLELNVANSSDYSTDELNNLMANLKLAGFLRVTKKEDEGKQVVFSGTKKTWRKNNTNAKKSDNPWKTMKLEDTKELIVEDELIDPFDSYQKFAKADDCITRPKPCKNCTCGRAEKENSETKTQVDPNFKSDCGKCYLGDAFRCAGCPYRGKPAFEPGDKVQFKNSDLAVNQVEEEKTVVNVKDKKVKIDL